jgi:hypothetical protein
MGTPAQDRANKANAMLSTGPNTVAGKKVSRRNAFKYGCTGKGAVLIDEDELTFEQRLEEWTDALNPKNSIQRFLVEHAVITSLQLSRIEQTETARRAQRVNDLYQQRQPSAGDPAVNELISNLRSNGPSVAPKLHATPEGLKFLLERWRELRAATQYPNSWSYPDLKRAEDMLGLARDATKDPTRTDIHHWYQLREDSAHNRFLPDEAQDARRQAAREKLTVLVDEQIASLEAELEALMADSEPSDLELALCLVDTTHQGSLLQRYRTSAASELLRTLKLLEQGKGPAEGVQSASGRDFASAPAAESQNEPNDLIIEIEWSCVEDSPFEALDPSPSESPPEPAEASPPAEGPAPTSESAPAAELQNEPNDATSLDSATNVDSPPVLDPSPGLSEPLILPMRPLPTDEAGRRLDDEG